MVYVLIILGLALLLALMAMWLILWAKPKGKRLKQSGFEKYWQQVIKISNQDNPSAKKQAIIEADKVLDLIARSMVEGENLGDRLRKMEKIFYHRERYQQAWTAHKVRNKIAHEIDYNLSESEYSMVMSNYRKVFEDLGYIVK
ncbi:MAG TPA: hypothetical protein PLZ62_02850 [bacterium]|nr:hypothetical protein [bacterium]